MSLLRGYAIEWYNAEAKKDNPTDWKSLANVLILRFGSTARSKRALLKIMQLKQDKDDVLQLEMFHWQKILQRERLNNGFFST